MAVPTAENIKNRGAPIVVASILILVSAKLSADTGRRTSKFSGDLTDAFAFFL